MYGKENRGGGRDTFKLKEEKYGKVREGKG